MSDITRTIAQLIQEGGQSRARKGALLGQTFSNIGQTIASIPAQIAQREAQGRQNELLAVRLQQEKRAADKEARAEADVKAIDEAMQSGDPDRAAIIKRLTSTGRGHLLPSVQKMWADADKSGSEAVKAKQEAEQRAFDYFGALAVTGKAMGADADSFNDMLNHAEKKGYDVTAERSMVQQNPEAIGKVMDSLIARSKYAPKEKPETGFTLSPGSVRFDESGKQIASVPAAAGSGGSDYAHFLDRFAKDKGKAVADLTTAEELAARKAFGQADDRPAINVKLPSGMTPGQEFTAVRQLGNDYTRETKAASTVQQQLALMKSSLASVKSGATAAGSQGVLVTFQKILDPISVVRESEYARSGSGQSLMNRLEGQWDKIVQGGAGVPVAELEKFVSLAEQFAKDQKRFADASRARINSIADKYGLDKDLITRDVAVPETPAAPTAKPKKKNPF